MAKAKKGGLGRGLNSLLGPAGEEGVAQPVQSSQDVLAHEAFPVKEEAQTPAPVQPVEKPALEPLEPKPFTEAQPALKQEETRPQESPKPVVDKINEDKVTIKSVVERPPRQEVSAAPIPESKKATEQVSTRIPEDSSEVPIEQVQPNPEQPRTYFKQEELEELAESIKRNGLLQPILVREKSGKFEIIAGERRWQACKLAGMKKVPVRVRDVDDDETIALALIENIQRSDLNPIEEAYGYRRMMERGNMTQSQVAQAVSKGRSTIANALRLLELPEEAQQLLFEDKITAGHARAILSVPTPEGRAKLTDKLVKDQISVRETEAIARLMSGKKNGEATPRPQAPKSYKTVARSLQDLLQTDVRVKSAKGKNKIEISFKDEADLERLFRAIASE